MACFVVWGLYLTVPRGFLKSRSTSLSFLFPRKWLSAGHTEGAEGLLAVRVSE